MSAKTLFEAFSVLFPEYAEGAKFSSVAPNIIKIYATKKSIDDRVLSLTIIFKVNKNTPDKPWEIAIIPGHVPV